MNCDDDSDVDIETITGTAWSVEMPGHSIQNISSASAPISFKPLVRFLNINTGNEMPNITRSYRIKKMPSRKSGKISVNQAASLKSQTENSAARCFVILEQEPKLPSDKKLTKIQSQPKYTHLHNNVRCHISAAISTTMVRSTQLARRTYKRIPAVCAIDKEGSYQYYLHRRIRRLIATMATYAQNLDREIRLLHFALDSYISDFDHEFTLMKSKVGSNDYKSEVHLLYQKINSCSQDMIKKSNVTNSTLKSYANDLEKKIRLLNSKITSYAHDLEMQVTLLNSKIKSFAVGVSSKITTLNSKSSHFISYVRREFDLLYKMSV